MVTSLKEYKIYCVHPLLVINANDDDKDDVCDVNVNQVLKPHADVVHRPLLYHSFNLIDKSFYWCLSLLLLSFTADVTKVFIPVSDGGSGSENV